MELIDPLNSVTVFYLTFLSSISYILTFLYFVLLTMMLTVLFFWVCYYIFTLVFVLQLFSLHYIILIKSLLKLPLTFLQTQRGILFLIFNLLIILVLVGMTFVIVWKMFSGRISLTCLLMLLLLVPKIVNGSRWEWLWISQNRI